jgi:hypothetical protein
MKRMEFARVPQGEHAGELVQYICGVGSPSVWKEAHCPPNPYKTGYGRAIPTRYRVRTINNRWRRVYCMCYSNSGTCYIRQNGKLIIVDIVEK